MLFFLRSVALPCEKDISAFEIYITSAMRKSVLDATCQFLVALEI